MFHHHADSSLAPIHAMLYFRNLFRIFNVQLLKKGKGMKRIFLTVSIMFLVYGTVLPQLCLPQGITFSTQEEIDNFQANYPGCTEIEGDVIISGDDITTLDGLNILTAFLGDLSVVGNVSLTNLNVQIFLFLIHRR